MLVNVLAFIYLDNFPLFDEEDGLFIARYSDEGLELRKRAFDSEDRSVLDQYAYPPGLRTHPVLHFTEGFSKPFYTVGLEGMRYLPGWTDEYVERALQADSGSVFVFGGSTTFGDGVPDGQTLGAYLNEANAGTSHLNFAVQAYDSLREVDKLLHLLRKGYRPDTVIFIDGLNDVTTFASSPYDILESPRTQGLVLDRGEVPAIFGMPVKENLPMAFAYSLPITHLYYKFTGFDFEGRPFARRREGTPVARKWQELMYLYFNWPEIQLPRAGELAREITDYYRANIEFVRQLGEAFGFQPLFIYQPIGLLDGNNLFLTPKFSASSYREVYRVVDGRIREGIANGELDMIDCSRSIVDSGIENGYVDATHFSPGGNIVLARCINDYLPVLTGQESAGSE